MCEACTGAIRFPTGLELEQVLVDFEALCGLPCCGGALDGSFMPIKKPAEYGHAYFCYKQFNAIIILGCVDARGIFTYVNAGRPGSVGDSYTFRHSHLYQKVTSGEWLAHSPQTIEGVQVNSLLAANAAFPLACMKCYKGSGLPPQKHSLNYSVVEQAFGRLKGRWKVMDGHCKISDPVFVRQFAMVHCGLYNVCERHQCPFEPGWLPDQRAYVDTTPASLEANVVIGSASSIRDAIAEHIHRHRPAPH